MEVKLLERSEREIQFSIAGIDNAFANAIRRAAVGEVPVMAIEIADITDNNSGLTDEVLAHRLGLIPFVFPLDTFNVRKECTCKGRGCSNCQVEISLDKAGPCIVRASDFVCESDSVKPLYPDTPIVELLEGQAVKITALAELGYGRDHSKWQASVAGYMNAPKSKADKGDPLAGGFKEDEFVFTVESVCGLTAEQVVERALDVVAQRAEEFAKEVKKAL
jgi:DNA-directed RNA polymerase subunit D